MAWVWLVLAGLLEVVWALGLKYSDGFTRFVPSVVTAVAAAASFWLLAVALKYIPLGTGYVIWVGIGAVGTALVGMWLFQEPATAARLVCIGLIVAGIIGLKLTSSCDLSVGCSSGASLEDGGCEANPAPRSPG